MSKQISLALVDDHDLLVDGLRGMFDSQPDIAVVGSAADSASALSLVERTQPTVLLLDVSIIGAPVTETVVAVSKVAPLTRIVVLSMHDDPQIVAELIGMGIAGYLVKSAGWDELLTAVRMTGNVQDRVLLSITRQSLERLGEFSATAAPQPSILSSREVEIMMFTSMGLSNQQIASKLGLTESTVKRHLHNVFSKLGAVSRLDAVNRAKEQGLLPSAPPHP